MERTKIHQLEQKIGEEVLVKGWIHETRDQSKINSIVLRDNSGTVQAVVREDSDIFNDLIDLPKESVVSVKGEVEKDKRAPEGIELDLKSYEVLSKPEEETPIPVIEKGDLKTSLPKRLDHRWIDLRKPKKLLIFKIWSCMERAMREYWYKNNFIEIHSPKLMSAPSESGSELFGIDYFGKEAYLAQSPQFYKQMAMAAGFEKVFEVGPVFRANPSHTSRHDTEFTLVDMEMSFIDSHEDIMKFEEEWLSFVIKRVKEEYGEEIKENFNVDIEVPETPFPCVTMKGAKEILKEREHSIKGDLDTKGEKILSKAIKEEKGHDFVFVTEFPYEIRPFYHMKKESNKELTKSYDLLWSGLEITTGAQREHRYKKLKEQAEEKELTLELLEDYLNFFKHGCPPHGGFGLSTSRMLMILLEMENVREVTFLPRDTGRLRP